ncbi:2-oxo acid dehydrogenase subunit E2 [Achromobacter sp. SD115]|uniref:Dihydrolipoamide acetyltransferase component of pyruvate dehydrogenase complex n=1 Tax=Achromobacter xylosoxidans (strain A8) TaxID=762376 RepID=E3HMH9_ACHXA|nr:MULTISPECIES: dihydrolipoamide acetyltransferase family protein [Achromobacter]ADP18206.1 branched-chain alpha-keto acid dehydrogenase subunit E2 [Achromobacter xylosoxidans A8]MBO1017078.1 2-oxo acid dehydrogenase subunit E2 [Achromobacter sp. SD115]
MGALNDLLMPKLGLTMTEGMLIEWSVAAGDQVKAGDPLFVVETDKVASEIAAEADGLIGEILVPAGVTVPVGAVVARWTGPGQKSDLESDAAGGDGTTSASAPMLAAQTPVQPATAAGGRIVATPLARRLARELDVDLAKVGGTGPGGRIKAADVRQAGEPGQAAQVENAAEQAVPVMDGGQRIVASGLVQSMARRMTQAKQVPHFYLSAEAEVSELLALRGRLNGQPDAPRLTLNHFVIAAVARALAALPQQNRIWNDDHIVQFQDIDIGVAVTTERGLMAPVLHGLAGATLDGIARQSDALLERVRSGNATRNDMSGGAISISNAGMFNVTYMTPIINPPQSAILGVGSIREVFRPDAQGAPALRREMGLVLAADHRLHDGAGALKFLNYVIELLQDPYRLLRTPIQG